MKDTLLKKGYPLFSKTHFLAIDTCLVSFAGLIHCFRMEKERDRSIMLKTVSMVPLLLETIQDVVLSLQHSMSAEYLPLHLCGQAMFIEPLHSHMKDGKAKKVIGNMIYSLFLPGAAMALVFPGWNNLPLLSPVSVKKYAAHFFLVLYGILIYMDGQVDLEWKDIWQEFAYLYGAALLLWPFNAKYGTNYLYTHEPVEPLAFVWKRFGKPAYIMIMIAAGVFLVSSMYGIDSLQKKEKSYENTVCHQ